MKIAYFDCFSGISGDMCLGALVDLGLSLADLSKALKGLRIDGFSLKRRRVVRGGLSATKVDVLIADGMDRPMTFQEILGSCRPRAFRRRCERVPCGFLKI